MTSIRIFNVADNEDLHWTMMPARSSDYTNNRLPLVTSILHEVKSIFDDIFTEKAVNAHKSLSILFTDDDRPNTSPDRQTIRLVASLSCPLAIIYEFAHELCHVMADDGAPDSYGWLEESLCQLMSFHVLRRFRNHLLMGKLPVFSSLVDQIEPYIQQKYKCKDIGEKSFPVFFNDNLAYLKKQRYDREMNHTIAKRLDELFTKTPEFWGIVPKLNMINPKDDVTPNLLKIAIAAGIEPERAALLLVCFFE